MEQGKPKERTWADVVIETATSIKVMEMNLAIANAVLAEAKSHVTKK